MNALITRVWRYKLQKLLMDWHPIEATPECQFSEAATAQVIQEMLVDRDIYSLYKMALMLNRLAHQQRMMAQWAAKEAASNLTRKPISPLELMSELGVG